jgi:DNA invertase Pin-like site-specific DNA recombinase
MSKQRFIAYYRVSTNKQKKSGLGLAAQKEAVSIFINSGNHKLVREFKEVESGKNDDRRQLNEALQLCKLTNSKLLIAKLDRLSRNVAFLAGLMESKVGFVCCDIPEANELTIHIMAAVAQDERKRISERTKAALKAAKARGTKLGNPNLAKVRNSDITQANKKRIEIASQVANELMPIINNIRSEGSTSLREIAAELNQLGITTARGSEWQATSVSRILSRAHEML